MSELTASENTDRLIRANVELSKKKSLGMSLGLTLFFGPLGLLYSNVKWGLIMFVATIVISAVTFGFGLIIMWPLNLVMAWRLVTSQNDQIEARVLNGAA